MVDRVCQDQEAGWRDEGLWPVAWIAVSYVSMLLPVSLWTLLGVGSLLVGALVAFAMWHGAKLRGDGPTRATQWAFLLLKVWPMWAIVCRAL